MKTETQKFDLSTWRKFINIAKPFFVSEARWKARFLLLLLILLSVSVSGTNVLMSYVSRDFMTALERRKEAEFFRLIFLFGGTLMVVVPIVVFYRFCEESLALLWRRWLSNYFIERYLNNRSYYKINLDKKIDNPDQRITDEVRAFTATSLSFLLIFFNSIITFFAFIGILWSISVNLTFILLIYAVIGSVGTFLFGRRLVGLNFIQLRREADLRYGLVHIRDQAESIAFYRGEEKESILVRQRLREAVRNFRLTITWIRNLGFFTTGYGYVANILPVIIVAPLYIRGEIQFGVITQASAAFAHVLGAVSLVIQQFERLSAFAASIERLSRFNEAMDKVETHKHDFRCIDTIESEQVQFKNLTVLTPARSRSIITNLNLTLEQGHCLLITGPSGSGKSSLMRSIAGLWDDGSGQIYRPTKNIMFLPQKPYMVLGTFRDQLLYSVDNNQILDNELQEVLKKVNLAEILNRVGGFEEELDWSNVLSLGEQQRVAFARLLLSKPQMAFLDEATSALDMQSEDLLYSLLKPLGISYVSIGHRPSLYKYHDLNLQLDGNGGWQVSQIKCNL